MPHTITPKQAGMQQHADDGASMESSVNVRYHHAEAGREARRTPLTGQTAIFDRSCGIQ